MDGFIASELADLCFEFSWTGTKPAPVFTGAF